MFLYELALELGDKSGELAELAATLGIEGLGAPSELTREQVQQIRAAKLGHAAPGAIPPPPPPIGSPMAAGAATPTTGGVPGPAMWAPPGEALVPPPAAPPSAGSIPPPPPPVGPGDPSPHLPFAAEPKFGRTQMAMVAAVVVLMVGLFGYMVTHSGPDAAAKQRVDAANERDRNEPAPTVAATVATTTTTEATPATTPTTTADGYDVIGDPVPGSDEPSSAPKDLFDYCNGYQHLSAFLVDVARIQTDTSITSTKALIDQNRANIELGLDRLVGGGPPSMAGDLATLAKDLRIMVDTTDHAKTIDDVQVGLSQIPSGQVATILERVVADVRERC